MQNTGERISISDTRRTCRQVYTLIDDLVMVAQNPMKLIVFTGACFANTADTIYLPCMKKFCHTVSGNNESCSQRVPCRFNFFGPEANAG
jgi:hypothetical protein